MVEAFKEPRWAIPGLLPEGAAMLAGKPKTGKSWLALDFALSVAGALAAMGSTLCYAGPVLYLALADTGRRLQGRIKAVLQDRPVPNGIDFATEWRAADAGGIDDIRTWLDVSHAAGLVVVDTLERIHGRSDRNEGVYQNDVQAIVPLKKLADKFSICILLVHHLRKEKSDDPLERISGSAGITGALDTPLILKREPNSPHAILYVRGRDVHEQEIVLQFDGDTGRWIKLGGADDFRRTEQRREVFRAMKEAGRPLKPTELAERLAKKTVTVRSIIHRMAQSGDLVPLADGAYRMAGQ
ncbi:MAG: AAA family ATPase [Alphaproteobacteria bacterium]|nr:AAA family ATPase [Alphaproteobacteria bacterium]